MKKMLEQKEIILADFDFKKVERAMKSLGWEWIDENQMKYSPTVNDLMKVANLCLDKVIQNQDKEDVYCIGGFEALKINGVLELRFIIEKNNTLSHLF